VRTGTAEEFFAAMELGEYFGIVPYITPRGGKNVEVSGMD